MKKRIYISSCPYQTQRLAYSLARKLIKSSKEKQKTVVLALIGELGSGKTTFTKGLARALGIKSQILSPTFVIERKFPLRKSKFRYFYHFDCYRLKEAKELLNLGFRDVISNPKNFVVIEWADKIKSILPPGTVFLKFKFVDENKRRINIYYE